MAEISYRPAQAPEFHEILRNIADLAEADFDQLVRSVRGPDGFKRSRARCEALARDIGQTEPSAVFFILSALEFLYIRVSEWADPDETRADVLRSFLQSADILAKFEESAEGLVGRLATLVEPNQVVDDARKLVRLTTGILENAVAFSSFVDLRPDFTDDRTDIKRLVPTIIFRITTDSDLDDEQSYVFQLTEQGLKKLRESVVDIEKKLDALRSDARLRELLAIRDKSDAES